MTQKSRLISMISTLKAASCDTWTPTHTQAFDLGLDGVPEGDCLMLTKAILRRFEWRPSIAEVMNLHAELTAITDPETWADDLAKLRKLVGKYGDSGAAHPSFPDAWPTIRSFGAPPEFVAMGTAAQRTVSALGGWIVFARYFDWSDSSDRAQFRDIYKAASISATDAALKAIRLEYRAKSRPTLNAPEYDQEPDMSDGSQEISRDQAASIMGRFGQMAQTAKTL